MEQNLALISQMIDFGRGDFFQIREGFFQSLKISNSSITTDPSILVWNFSGGQ